MSHHRMTVPKIASFINLFIFWQRCDDGPASGFLFFGSILGVMFKDSQNRGSDLKKKSRFCFWDSLTWNDGGSLKWTLLLGAGVSPSSIASSWGLRYSSSDWVGLLTSKAPACFPHCMWVGSARTARAIPHIRKHTWTRSNSLSLWFMKSQNQFAHFLICVIKCKSLWNMVTTAPGWLVKPLDGNNLSGLWCLQSLLAFLEITIVRQDEQLATWSGDLDMSGLHIYTHTHTQCRDLSEVTVAEQIMN